MTLYGHDGWDYGDRYTWVPKVTFLVVSAAKPLLTGCPHPLNPSLEPIDIIEQLCHNIVGSGVDFLLQILHLLLFGQIVGVSVGVC